MTVVFHSFDRLRLLILPYNRELSEFSLEFGILNILLFNTTGAPQLSLDFELSLVDLLNFHIISTDQLDTFNNVLLNAQWQTLHSGT